MQWTCRLAVGLKNIFRIKGLGDGPFIDEGTKRGLERNVGIRLDSYGVGARESNRHKGGWGVGGVGIGAIRAIPTRTILY